MKPWNIIAALGLTTKRLEKEDILKSIGADSEFWAGGSLALDKFKMFGIKKLPKPGSHPVIEPTDTWPRFEALAGRLVDRKLTGNAARDAVQAFAEYCTKDQWDGWYARVLEKDLDCGVAEASFNKFAPNKFKVEPFGVQLAKSMKDVPTEKLFRSAHVEAKYDGARTLWFITRSEADSDDPFSDSDLNYDVKCLSRSGKELFNFGEIAAQLGQLTKLSSFGSGKGIVIDGEIMSHSFNQLMTQFRRKDFSDRAVDAYLVAFDIIDYDVFMKRTETPPLEERRMLLERVIRELHEELEYKKMIPLVVQSISLKGVDPVTQQAEIMDFYEQQLAAGFEGVIVKDATAPYEWERTVKMLKIKPTITVDLEVVNFTPGRGKYEGTLGALDCAGHDEEGRHITVGVSGISDDLRHSIWAEGIDKVRGRVVEVTADAVSMNKDGTYSLRFPRFKSFRNDK